MKKLMFIFGTRPEFIKIYPIYIESLKQGNDVILVSTGQHKEMLNQLIDYFNVKIDYNLAIMEKSNGLVDILTNSLQGLKQVFNNENPDVILVHGDTSATLAGSIIAYYYKIKLAHIEAGLRTNNKYSPFPEEINRKITTVLADYHFAPTKISYENLIRENVKDEDIYIVGNSAIDMLKYTICNDYSNSVLKWQDSKKLILITAHRRENLEELDDIFYAIDYLASKYYDEFKFVYPMHLNPIIRKKSSKYFKSDNIKIIDPLDTIDFHNIMSKSYLIMTDSGGIQEEAPSLGIPVLVLRNVTERPEGVLAGTLKLVGTNSTDIINAVVELIEDQDIYNDMCKKTNPYGDGTTATKIVRVLNDK
ncbi:MAG: non-hydrolyzing UDP-N-acetylglucosamine 2-epimerase [Bacilli bacterium]